MKTVCEINKCNGCMVCVSKCPKKCIKVVDDIEYLNAVIDEKNCLDCKMCEKTCPNNNNFKKNKPIEWKQGWSSPEIRETSSSGGVASAIINAFIEDGGLVATCLFKEGDFIFEITDDKKAIKKFSGSKYVKSNPIGIYEKINECLKDRKVLFIGLPCQVSALKNYTKMHDNLYTIDLICHGTPSIKLLNEFLLEEGIDIKYKNDIKFRKNIDFGIFVDGKKIEDTRVMDAYTCGFLKSINYTENCYSCKFASIERVSDITLGDSWGTEYKDEENKGISLILIQNDKGKEMLNKSNIIFKDVDLENAISHNHQLSSPSVRTKNRDKFFNLLKKGYSIKKATFIVLPKMIIKQKIKKIMIKLHIFKVNR